MFAFIMKGMKYVSLSNKEKVDVLGKKCVNLSCLCSRIVFHWRHTSGPRSPKCCSSKHELRTAFRKLLNPSKQSWQPPAVFKGQFSPRCLCLPRKNQFAFCTDDFWTFPLLSITRHARPQPRKLNIESF